MLRMRFEVCPKTLSEVVHPLSSVSIVSRSFCQNLGEAGLEHLLEQSTDAVSTSAAGKEAGPPMAG